MTAYYNEHDPFAAAWLRELIKAGHIAPGEVDERSIEDVLPTDLRGFTQCHFFAGIGVWSYALRQAGWPDDRPVWTGSCPCQPFSAAGKRKGIADERHLWPAFFHLIEGVKPPTIFGEQVASKDGLAWFDTVFSDLEGVYYDVGAADLCAAGFGAPHIRQRLYFVAHSAQSHKYQRASSGEQSLRQSGEGYVRLDSARGAQTPNGSDAQRRQNVLGDLERVLVTPTFAESKCCDRMADPQRCECRPLGILGRSEVIQSDGAASADELAGDREAVGCRTVGNTKINGHEGQCLRRDGKSAKRIEEADTCELANNNNNNTRLERRQGAEERSIELPSGASGLADELAYAEQHECGQVGSDSGRGHEGSGVEGLEQRSLHGGLVNGFWREADWIYCRDGKYRPVEPGTFPLAHGATNRVGRLRGYGNALVAPVATAFIEAFLETEKEKQ